jgi:lipopolysaccharide transport system permease protein
VRSEYLAELWSHRELLYFLAWRDVKIRYKQAALGMSWAIIQPLLTMIIFSVLFGRFAQIPSDGVPYPVFSYSALLLWMYFSVTLALAGNSLIGNANLITKVYFPRVLMPAASALAGILDLAIGSTFLVGLMLYYRTELTWTVLLAPVFVVHLFVLALGISMLLAAMNVKYRDVKYVIPFLTQIWMFVTPIIYPITFVPDRYQWLLALNPVTGVVEGFRAAVLGAQPVPWRVVGISWGITLLLALIGAVYFRKTERQFADVV